MQRNGRVQITPHTYRPKSPLEHLHSPRLFYVMLTTAIITFFRPTNVFLCRWITFKLAYNVTEDHLGFSYGFGNNLANVVQGQLNPVAGITVNLVFRSGRKKCVSYNITEHADLNPFGIDEKDPTGF